MSLKEFFDLIFIGVVLCVAISIPCLWLKYSYNKINKFTTIFVFILLTLILAYLFIQFYK